jgi:sec-independent protein translocase protein TatA
MFGSIGMPELIVIFLVALLFFGPRKLPELGRSLGKSLGEFKRATRELRSTLEEEIEVEERQVRTAPPAPPQPARSDDASYARSADPGA